MNKKSKKSAFQLWWNDGDNGCPTLVLNNDEDFAVATWNAAIACAMLVLSSSNPRDLQEAVEMICDLSETEKRVNANDLSVDYFESEGCICAAYGECECGCGADWTPRVEKLVEMWRDMPAAEMRLRCGEMTAQEIRTVRAVLNQILPTDDRRCH